MNGFAAKHVVAVGLFTDKAMIVIDGQHHILSVNGKSVMGVRLLSSNSEKATVEINGKTEVLMPNVSVGSVNDSGSEARVQVWPDRQGMYMTTGSINGYTVKFLLDTGASFIVMNSNVAKRLGIRYRVDSKIGKALTASGTVRTYNIKLKVVTVGGIRVNNINAAVIQGNYPRQILLGMSFLSKVKMQNKGRALVLIQ